LCGQYGVTRARSLGLAKPEFALAPHAEHENRVYFRHEPIKRQVAAAAAGIPCTVSTGSVTAMEKIADQAGARHAITIFRDEIDRVLALIGCPSIAELNRDHLILRKAVPVQK
jgi:isopentenyl diphosphate isomerase/L-lactate dehydrogenase-like FMN-dependent dehydrogenase